MNNRNSFKLSKFNVFTKNREGHLLLTNTLSNVLIKIIDHRASTVPIDGLDEVLISRLADNDFEIFIKYGLLVEKHVDEKEIVNQVFHDNVENNKRLDIVILTTNQCNFSCVYCFQKREPHFLNYTQYDALVSFVNSKINERGYKNLKLRWFGGEPLLDKKGIFYFSEKINQLKKTLDFTYGCGIITNGYLLDIETFKQLYKYNVVTYQVSIDGLPDIKHRVLNNGEATFGKIFDNLKAIKNQIKYSMFSITIRINFTKELLKRADEIVELFYKEFSDDKRFCFSFIPVFDWSYKDSDYMKAENLQEELIHENDVSNLMKKYGDKLDFKAWSNLLFARNDCWAGTKHGYTIDANGEILKCDFKLEGFEENKVGKIDKEGNFSFDNGKEKKWIFDSPLPACYHCECFPLCLSTSCGAARIQGIMPHKCISFKQRVLDYLEIESYNPNNHFMEVEVQ